MSTCLLWRKCESSQRYHGPCPEDWWVWTWVLGLGFCSHPAPASPGYLSELLLISSQGWTDVTMYPTHTHTHTHSASTPNGAQQGGPEPAASLPETGGMLSPFPILSPVLHYANLPPVMVRPNERWAQTQQEALPLDHLKQRAAACRVIASISFRVLSLLLFRTVEDAVLIK